MLHYKEPIFQCSGPHLGDVWASVNYYATQCVKLNTWKPSLVQECLDTLEHPNLLTIVDEPATEPPVEFLLAFETRYLATKVIWNPDNITEKLLCYQFNSRTVKPPAQNEIDLFLQRAKAAGYRIDNIGDMRPLSDSIKALSKASMFVSPMSGFAEVCRSVGTPMRVVGDYYNNVHYPHKTSDLQRFKSLTNIPL